jgi:putative transposase
MIRGIEKRRIVDDETDRRNFVRRLGALAEETRTPIYAWALMSNHAHILLCSGALGLAKFMRRLLTGYAVSYNLRHRRASEAKEAYRRFVAEGVMLGPLRQHAAKKRNRYAERVVG